MKSSLSERLALPQFLGYVKNRPRGAERLRLARFIYVGIAGAALTGCATQTRYVSTYCLTHDQALPAEPERIKSKLTGKADTDIGIVAGSAIRLRAWGEGLQTILNGCREPSH